MSGSTGALVDGYDLVIADLDGVVYLGEQVIPAAVPAFGQLREHGVAVEFATNNASRRADAVAALLSSLGVAADATEVITSAQASAAVLAQELAAGARVLVVGAQALASEVRDAGLVPVREAGDEPVAVVQGYAPEVGWTQLAEACVAIRAGARWVATNTDRTLPSERGPLPGNGSLVAALATALDRPGPDLSVGKPGPALFEQAAQRRGAHRPLVLGDRLDTDIEGANRAGLDSVLVLTGVSTAADVLRAVPARRPTFVTEDAGGLFVDAASVRTRQGTGHGAWQVDGDADTVRLSGAGSAVEALRALCDWYWSPQPPRRVVPESAAARDVVRTLGLTVEAERD